MSEFERLPVPAVAWTDEGLTVKLNPELVGRVTLGLSGHAAIEDSESGGLSSLGVWCRVHSRAGASRGVLPGKDVPRHV